MIHLALVILAICIIIPVAFLVMGLFFSPVAVLISWIGGRKDPKCGPKLGDPGVTSRFRC
jgi:hypothetical protein